tara:strand:+ start:398 stop:586 length:189 start_codon:yes stop_codon:yes gene_type:complete
MRFKVGELVEFIWSPSKGGQTLLALYIGREEKDIKAKAKILYNGTMLWIDPIHLKKVGKHND